jgi:hypothetical protein
MGRLYPKMPRQKSYSLVSATLRTTQTSTWPPTRSSGLGPTPTISPPEGSSTARIRVPKKSEASSAATSPTRSGHRTDDG